MTIFFLTFSSNILSYYFSANTIIDVPKGIFTFLISTLHFETHDIKEHLEISGILLPVGFQALKPTL